MDLDAIRARDAATEGFLWMTDLQRKQAHDLANPLGVRPMSGWMPPPFVCYHPRARWVAEGSGSYSSTGSEYTLTGYRCGICSQWIPPDAVPWPTDEEVLARLERDLVKYKDAFDRLGDR